MTAAMNLATTMDALATASGVSRAYGYPKDDAEPPCVIVGYPIDAVELDVTFGVGNAKATFPVWYVVGRVVEKATRDKVSAAMSSMKTAIEAASLVVRCTEATFEPVILGGITYMAVRMDCEVYS